MTGERPTAAELVAAVREWLEADARPHLEGRAAFHARVAANALAIVERELLGADALEAAAAGRAARLLGHDGRFAELEVELARRIRAGDLDDRRDEVFAHVRATVRDRLAVDHPGYAGDAPDTT